MNYFDLYSLSLNICVYMDIYIYAFSIYMGSLVAQMVKNPPAVQETQVSQSL